MNVLSLFDGISSGQIALNRAGIKYEGYYASEIDKHAIKVTQFNWPHTVQLGSVVNVDTSKLPRIDLLIGGSPCQSFSFMGKRNGMSTIDKQEVLTLDYYLELKSQNYQFEGYSYLFWEYIRVLKETSPRFFFLENVKMSKKWEKVISDIVGVPAIKINSNLVSGQTRPRFYWTNIPISSLPADKQILARDIKESDDGFPFPATVVIKMGRKFVKKIDKMPSLTTDSGSPNGLGRPFWIKDEFFLEKPFDYSKVKRITPVEAERLQTVPDNYTSVISDSKRYHALGNGWTVDVIAHIFKGLS